MIESLGLGLIYLAAFMGGFTLLMIWRGSGDVGGLFEKQARLVRPMIPFWIVVGAVGVVLTLVGLAVG